VEISLLGCELVDLVDDVFVLHACERTGSRPVKGWGRRTVVASPAPGPTGGGRMMPVSDCDGRYGGSTPR
jgi:hypothetical protein